MAGKGDSMSIETSPHRGSSRLRRMALLVTMMGALAGSALAQSAPSAIWGYAGSGKNTIVFNSIAGASSYNLYRSTTPGGEGSTPYMTGFNPGNQDTSVTNGTKYY